MKIMKIMKMIKIKGKRRITKIKMKRKRKSKCSMQWKRTALKDAEALWTNHERRGTAMWQNREQCPWKCPKMSYPKRLSSICSEIRNREVTDSSCPKKTKVPFGRMCRNDWERTRQSWGNLCTETNASSKISWWVPTNCRRNCAVSSSPKCLCRVRFQFTNDFHNISHSIFSFISFNWTSFGFIVFLLLVSFLFDDCVSFRYLFIFCIFILCQIFPFFIIFVFIFRLLFHFEFTNQLFSEQWKETQHFHFDQKAHCNAIVVDFGEHLSHRKIYKMCVQ